MDNKQQQCSEGSSGEEARCFYSHLCRRGSQQTLPTLIKYRINTPCHAQSALLIGQTYMRPLPRTASSITPHITQLRSHVPNSSKKAAALRNTMKGFLPWRRQTEFLWPLPGIRMRSGGEEAFSQGTFYSFLMPRKNKPSMCLVRWPMEVCR